MRLTLARDTRKANSYQWALACDNVKANYYQFCTHTEHSTCQIRPCTCVPLAIAVDCTTCCPQFRRPMMRCERWRRSPAVSRSSTTLSGSPCRSRPCALRQAPIATERCCSTFCSSAVASPASRRCSARATASSLVATSASVSRALHAWQRRGDASSTA